MTSVRRLAAILPNLARPLAGLKIRTNSMCRHVIFIVFFKFWIENASSDGFNQFLTDIPSFWCIICRCSRIRSYLPPKKYWWQYNVTVATYPLALLTLERNKKECTKEKPFLSAKVCWDVGTNHNLPHVFTVYMTWNYYVTSRYLLRSFHCLAHPNLSATFAADQK